MASLEFINISLRPGSAPERTDQLVEQVNDRLRLVRDVVHTNDGAAIHWPDTALPTATIEFAGRFLYHDQGQGATPDNFYLCLWNGAAWTWVLLA